LTVLTFIKVYDDDEEEEEEADVEDVKVDGG
jgi:hypothetical protein